MKNPFARIAPLLLLPLLAGPPAAAVEIFGVENVKAGMVGTGYTSWEGTKVEPFELEVVGVLRHTTPGRHMILAEARGGILEETGIPEGISGSPFYIDGRLVGACAFTWSFTKRPVVGITPVEYMLDLMSRDEASPAGSRSARHLELPPFDPGLVHALAEGAEPVFLGPLRRMARPVEAGQGLVPIRVPLSLSGLSGRTLDPLRGLLDDLGLTPVSAGRMEGGPGPEAGADLRPGSTVGAALIRGDLRMDAYGAVTHIAGEHVFAFGHPFFSSGAVEFPMSAGWVHTVVPRQSVSFKVVSHLRDVGVFRQDREAGLYGVLGREPRMLPLHVEVERGDGVVETFALELVRDPALTPLLAFISLQEILIATEKGQGEATIQFLEGSRIEVGGYPAVGLENFYSGPNPVWEASGAISSYLAWILNNEFEVPDLQAVHLKLRADEGRRSATIQRVQFGRGRAQPGETVPLEIFLKPYRGDLYRETLEVEIPAGLPDGKYVLTVGAAAAVDRLSPAPRGAALRSLAGLLDLIDGMRRNANIYVQLARSDPSLLVGGEFLPDLPPTMEAMLRSERTKGDLAVFSRSELLEEEVAIPYRVRGLQQAPLEVRSE